MALDRAALRSPKFVLRFIEVRTNNQISITRGFGRLAPAHAPLAVCLARPVGP
jgi:hypothetical protein